MKKRVKGSTKKEYRGRISLAKGIQKLSGKNDKAMSHRILRAKDKEALIKEVGAGVPPTRVEIIESERGWGARQDEVKTFPTRALAEDFVRDFNQRNTDDYAKTGIVPDWYMYARILEN